MPELAWKAEKEDAPENNGAVMSWLESQMTADTWLLAHADDGVIWGRLINGKLVTSGAVLEDEAAPVSPPLRGVTLQQAYIFGPAAEVRLWREENVWHARRITGPAQQDALPDEAQILWGTQVVDDVSEAYRDYFTHVRERQQQGLDHVVPCVVTETTLTARKLKLVMRHYLEYDAQTGAARIALSRLVNLTCS